MLDLDLNLVPNRSVRLKGTTSQVSHKFHQGQGFFRKTHTLKVVAKWGHYYTSWGGLGLESQGWGGVGSLYEATSGSWLHDPTGYSLKHIYLLAQALNFQNFKLFILSSIESFFLLANGVFSRSLTPFH